LSSSGLRNRASVTCGARQPGADQRLFDLVAQLDETGVALGADPQRVRPVAAECAGAGQVQREWRRLESDQRFVDIGGLALVDFADETQRQVEISGVDPAGARHAGAHQRQPQLQFRRKLDADEQAQHGVPLFVPLDATRFT
jgi:hypothetical protein